MKKFIAGMFLLLGLQGWGQTDTLIEEDLRRAADIVFGQLDSSLFRGALINRSFSTSGITNRQLSGDYNQVHSVIEFFELYSDLRLSYIDSSQFMSNDEFPKFIENVFIENELNDDEDKLIQPFGFVLHNISMIDSTKLNGNYFSKSGFSIVPTAQETDYYQKTVLKSGALIEIYPESGYLTGKLQYVPELISTSPDIRNLVMKINAGNGFLPFNETNNLIEYNRIGDSLIGLLAFTYELNQEKYFDTLQFYLTTKGETSEKNATFWDFVGVYTNSTTIKFKVGFLRGCGNTTLNPKRPIFFVPPYRPSIQPVSMKKYFDQFNVDGLFNKLVDQGYDVLFIKLKPGNKSLETAAQALTEYITKINELKAEEFPDESWENIVAGYSMGGQIARYCLKKMEYDHMMSGTPHHHTRLYIPFDSPHLGANIPMFTQAVYKDLKHLSIFAGLAYLALDDEASRDMSVVHINGSVTSIEDGGFGNPNIYHIIPGPTSDRDDFMASLHLSFNHSLSITSDLRRTFPSFTRNISIATGSNTKDYNELFSLNPGKLLFNQSAIGYFYGGLAYKLRRIYASKREYDHSVFRNKEQMLTFLIPITYRDRDYRVSYSDEWDMAQGGYKDEFYDKNVTGVTFIMRLGAFGLGQKHYDNHMSFLPMVSALAINKNIWQLGNLHYNIKDEGLMYNIFNFNPNTDKSDMFGYPNLGRQSDHFQVTPFEAIYCDPQTYEHIKLQESMEENEDDANNNNPAYLGYTTRFMLDEIEANDVYLQNKVIGKNHVQWDPNYTYTAWYKAKNKLTIGMNVTPKTDPGAYVIEATGNITTYAGKEINIKPGFHAQQGADFHAYIDMDDCVTDQGKTAITSRPQVESAQNEKTLDEQEVGISRQEEISIYPNPSPGEINIVFPDRLLGDFTVFSYLGERILQQVIPEERTLKLNLQKGHYLLHVKTLEGNTLTKQIIVL